MAKSNSVNVNEILENMGETPEAKGFKIGTIVREKFTASVKKDGTFKSIGLYNRTHKIETADMARQTGFPVGSTIAINCYLPVKKAKTEQIKLAVNNYRAAKEAKSNTGAGELNVSDFEGDDDDAE